MTLSSHVKISSGRSFRGAIKSTPNGPHHVIQLRDIESDGDEYCIKTDDLIKTEIKTNRKIPFLSNGDILVSSKGSTLRAYILKNIPESTVCTQHFFLLTPDKAILPEFIIAIINLPTSQRYIHQHSSGSYQKMLTLTTLSKMPFPEMSLAEQQQFIELCNKTKEEKLIMMRMIENREKQLASLVSEYTHDD
ncbi:restriction endonuclease subunit S [Colwellia sp. 6_MG-2023]|uniref:restriction endonuclease subunit S n=1 Tax=Colwellia sp. 6_MG-2023 TaxID=3062676 RepID=UPI0026E25DBA|nr:restriction endonuclease subunit S [Colwellia sp. 6_MG-2023]MDO6487907.1 restriction endonuclease subunit S [Colwellia sp. 6_MG-2023]